MQISQACLALIEKFEGCKLKAYRCPAGVLTIGIGHTGPDVTEGQTMTKAQAYDLLRSDLRQAETGVLGSVTVPLTQQMLDALVSLAFNIGVTAFQKSTLLKKLNSGDYKAAADQLLSWNKAGGKILRGLTERRQDERKLFLSGIGVSTYAAV